MKIYAVRHCYLGRQQYIYTPQVPVGEPMVFGEQIVPHDNSCLNGVAGLWICYRDDLGEPVSVISPLAPYVAIYRWSRCVCYWTNPRHRYTDTLYSVKVGADDVQPGDEARLSLTEPEIGQFIDGCHSISDSAGIDIEVGSALYAGPVLGGLSATTAMLRTAPPVTIGAGGALLRGVALRSLATGLLRAGTMAARIIRGGTVIGLVTLAVEGALTYLRRQLPQPIPLSQGDIVEITFEPTPLKECPLLPPDLLPPPPAPERKIEDLTSPLPEPQISPLPEPPELLPPQDTTDPDTDRCCQAICGGLYQIGLQLHGLTQQLQHLGDVHAIRMEDLIRGMRDTLLALDSTELMDEIRKIRKGVYHVRPGTTEEYPLATEILGLLDGLNIYLK